MSVIDHLSATPSARPDRAHVVQFYTDDEFLLDSLCQFVLSAIAEGESAVLIVSKDHRKGLMKRLRACGGEVSAAIRDGRCRILDAVSTLAKLREGDTLNSRKFAQVIGSVLRQAEAAARKKGRRVAAFGEMVALLCAEQNYEAAIELEQMWNGLARTHHFHLRCAYPTSTFDGDNNGQRYTAVCAEHSTVMLA